MNCNRTDCFNLSGDEAARSRVAQMVRFRLGIPKRAEVEVHSHLCEGNNVTEVRVTGGNAGSIQFNIPLQAEAVTEDDVDAACEAFLGGEGSSLPGIYRRLMRLGGWWVIFAGSLTVFSVCPVCGQVGCPAGVGLYAVLSVILACAKEYLKDFMRAFSSVFRRVRKRLVLK